MGVRQTQYSRKSAEFEREWIKLNARSYSVWVVPISGEKKENWR